MRPLIGIPCHPELRPLSGRPIYGNNRAYVHAVESAGGIPVLIPLLGDLNGLNSLLPRLDGLLLSGGYDIQPHYYHETPHPMLGAVDARLDELEFAIARWAIEEDIPTLGICRGMQLLNIALGGSLYQDLVEQYEGSLLHPNWDQPRGTIVHSITIEAGSRMEQIFGTSEILTNSLHHQGIKTPGKGVRISGHAPDGVAELLEAPGKRFILGAQCHPEELYQEHPEWLLLFEAFTNACVAPIVRTLEKVEHIMSVGVM